MQTAHIQGSTRDFAVTIKRPHKEDRHSMHELKQGYEAEILNYKNLGMPYDIYWKRNLLREKSRKLRTKSPHDDLQVQTETETERVSST